MEPKEKLRILKEQKKKEEEKRRELESLIEEAKQESEEMDREERGEKDKKDEKIESENKKEESIEDKVKDAPKSEDPLRTYDFNKKDNEKKDPYSSGTQEQVYSGNVNNPEKRSDDYHVGNKQEENKQNYSGTRDSLTFENKNQYTFN